jgi:hypothetical protein
MGSERKGESLHSKLVDRNEKRKIIRKEERAQEGIQNAVLLVPLIPLVSQQREIRELEEMEGTTPCPESDSISAIELGPTVKVPVMFKEY